MPQESEVVTKKKLLIVEDDPFQSDLYKRVFENAGYEVVLAADGLAALETAQKVKVDLILLDIMLPKLDGLQVLKRLRSRKETKEIPVFLLSNLGQETVVEESLKIGAEDYLIKATLLPRQVVAKIDAFFAGK